MSPIIGRESVNLNALFWPRIRPLPQDTSAATQPEFTKPAAPRPDTLLFSVLGSVRQTILQFFRVVGDMTLFGFRIVREAFRPPFELSEIIRQLFEIGWRSGPLLIVSGFAFGVVLALETRASMESFGAEAMIPQAVSFGLFTDIGPLIAALLVAGRVGAGIGAELAGMRVTEQIDAFEALAVDSFKYLVVTRVVACFIAMPILTTLLNFSGLAGGMAADLIALRMSPQLFINDAFSTMGWSDYIPPTAKTVVFGLIIGLVSTYLGYNASHGAEGVGRSSTRSVVFSSLLVIMSDVVLVKSIQFWFPG
jgi:phospholipid/cholesterol/gamma-HCH transport system permease protein